MFYTMYVLTFKKRQKKVLQYITNYEHSTKATSALQSSTMQSIEYKIQTY